MSQTLHGLCVLNTRPEHQAAQLTQAIQEAGGRVIACPTLKIIKTSTNWISSLPNLNQIQQALFISANAVHYCFTELLQHQIDWPPHIRVIAIGKASAQALTDYKIQVHEKPEFPDSEHVLNLKCLQQIKDQNVLLFKGLGGRPLIEQELTQRRAHVISVSVYQRTMPKVDSKVLQSIRHQDLVDIILITSEQSLHNLFKMFGSEAINWLQGKTYLVLSERLAQAAGVYGIRNIITGHPNQMMQTLFDYAQGLTNDK